MSAENAQLNTTPVKLEGSKVISGPFGVPLMHGAAGGKINTTMVNGADSMEMCSSEGFVWLKGLNGTKIPHHEADKTGHTQLNTTYDYTVHKCIKQMQLIRC